VEKTDPKRGEGREAQRHLPPFVAQMTIVAELLNYALALFFWLILGRIALTLLTNNRQGFFMGVFVKGTEPVFAVVRRLTGNRVGERGVALLSLLLLVVLRIALVPVLRG
jgi:uncharacterized protein YggT (Ycf19 family)